MKHPNETAELLLSPNFFLDTSSRIAKMSISALKSGNADMLILCHPTRFAHTQWIQWKRQPCAP